MTEKQDTIEENEEFTAENGTWNSLVFKSEAYSSL